MHNRSRTSTQPYPPRCPSRQSTTSELSKTELSEEVQDFKYRTAVCQLSWHLERHIPECIRPYEQARIARLVSYPAAESTNTPRRSYRNLEEGYFIPASGHGAREADSTIPIQAQLETIPAAPSSVHRLFLNCCCGRCFGTGRSPR